MSQSRVDAALVVDSIDLQVNGYVGVDFNDPRTTREAISHAAQAMRGHSVAAALPTIITAAPDTMLACIDNMRQAIESDAQVATVFRGLHVEGPFLSPRPGFIGAHPLEHAQR
ncbi:MAG: hypothetical protein ABI557_19950, partial [Aureliella sp.]